MQNIEVTFKKTSERKFHIALKTEVGMKELLAVS